MHPQATGANGANALPAPMSAGGQHLRFRAAVDAGRAAGRAVLTYSPLAQGLLAGRQLRGAPLPDDWRRDYFYFRPANVSLVNAGLEGVALPIARARGSTPAQIALAWLLGPSNVAVVAGARSPAQAAANAAAATT